MLDIIFKTEGQSLYWDGSQMSVLIQITEDSVYVIENENKKVRMQAYLKELQYVIINDDAEQAGGITLCFVKKGGFFAEISFKVQKIEELLSAILRLRSLLNL